MKKILILALSFKILFAEGSSHSGANCYTGYSTQWILQAKEIQKAEVK